MAQSLTDIRALDFSPKSSEVERNTMCSKEKHETHKSSQEVKQRAKSHKNEVKASDTPEWQPWTPPLGVLAAEVQPNSW